MNCPVCDAKLREVTRMNVQIDICPDCKGVWLDRGELEKIIEYVEGNSAPQYNERPEPRREEYRQDGRREHHDHDDHDHDKRYSEHGREERRYDDRGREIDPRTGRPRKREGFLSNVFDMFGGDD